MQIVILCKISPYVFVFFTVFYKFVLYFKFNFLNHYSNIIIKCKLNVHICLLLAFVGLIKYCIKFSFVCI